MQTIGTKFILLFALLLTAIGGRAQTVVQIINGGTGARTAATAAVNIITGNPIAPSTLSIGSNLIVPSTAVLPYVGWKVYSGSGAPTDTCSSTLNTGALETNTTPVTYQCSNATGTYVWNSLGGGGGGDAITSPGGTLTVGGSTTNTTLDIALGHSNTWSAEQIFGTNISIGGVAPTGATGTGNIVFSASPAFTGTIIAANLTLSGTPIFTGIESGSGSTCLQINSFGAISNTGLPCGSGSGAVSSISGDGSLITNSLSTGAVTLTLGSTESGQFAVSTGSGSAAWAKQITLGHQNDGGALANGYLTIAGSSSSSGVLTLSGVGVSPGQMSLYLNGAGTTMALGGTNASVTSAGAMTAASFSGSGSGLTGIPLSGLASESANTVVGNGTGSSGSPTALTMPSCSTSSSSLIWTSGTGFGCHSSSSALSSLTSATGSNTIANGNNGSQVWNWALTSNSETAFTFGETSASTGTSDQLLAVSTLAGSTATPLTVSDSLTGSQTLSALQILPTWNTTGVVDAALLVNVTNTASGAGSKLFDLQVGGISQANVDKAGNLALLGGLSLGSSPPSCGTGVTGCVAMAEASTAATGTSGVDTIRADSTNHNLYITRNGSAEFPLNSVVSGSGTYTTATSDAITVTGATSSSHCTFSPTNSTAAAATVVGYISAVASNSVTITHVGTTASGGTVDVVCTIN